MDTSARAAVIRKHKLSKTMIEALLVSDDIDAYSQFAYRTHDALADRKLVHRTMCDPTALGREVMQVLREDTAVEAQQPAAEAPLPPMSDALAANTAAANEAPADVDKPIEYGNSGGWAFAHIVTHVNAAEFYAVAKCGARLIEIHHTPLGHAVCPMCSGIPVEQRLLRGRLATLEAGTPVTIIYAEDRPDGQLYMDVTRHSDGSIIKGIPSDEIRLLDDGAGFTAPTEGPDRKIISDTTRYHIQRTSDGIWWDTSGAGSFTDALPARKTAAAWNTGDSGLSHRVIEVREITTVLDPIEAKPFTAAQLQSGDRAGFRGALRQVWKVGEVEADGQVLVWTVSPVDPGTPWALTTDEPVYLAYRRGNAICQDGYPIEATPCSLCGARKNA